MELSQARVFLVLAEEGSMTGAAQRLSITQPAISASLSGFEREIGYTLFHRSRKGVTLTEQGRALIAKAGQLLETAREIESSGKRRSSTEGVIRIAGRQGFMQYLFPHLVAMLRQKAPGIVIERAISGDQHMVVDALRNGLVDLAFAASPEIKSISHEVIYHDAVWLAVAKKHPLSRQKSVKLADLSKLDLCLPSSTDRLRKPIDLFLKSLPKKPMILLETNDYTLMKNLIGEGICGGFIYAHMLLEERSQVIAPLAVHGLDLRRDLTVLHRRDDLALHVAFARAVFIKESQRLLNANESKYGLKKRR